MGLTGLRDSNGAWHLYMWRSLFSLSTFFVASIVFMKGTSCCVIMLRVRCFKVVGSLLSNQNTVCRNTARIFIPLKRSNSTQDFTTSSTRLVNTPLCYNLINTTSVDTSQSPQAFHANFVTLPINTTDERDYSLNTPGKKKIWKLHRFTYILYSKRFLNFPAELNKETLRCKTIYSSRRKRLK